MERSAPRVVELSASAPEPGGWIGAAPSRTQVLAALVVGCVGVLVAGLQPVLLGSLQAAGRITAAELGHAATLELLALGLGAGLSGTLLEGRRLKPVVIAAGLIYALANVMTLGVRGEMLTLVRGLAGLPGGVMIWVATEMIVRSPTPTRWAGIYLAVQTLAQLAVASALALFGPTSTTIAPLSMAALGGVALLAAFALPRAFEPLEREPTASGLPPPRGWAVLTAVVLVNACIVGAWVYLEPLGAQAKIPHAVVALATPLSLAMQILGAGCAVVLAGRIPWFGALAVAAVVLIAATLGLSLLPGAMPFLLLQAVFGFVWLFILPYFVPLAIEADPTRRTALLGNAANLIGSAAGPLAASMLVGDSDARAALHLCAGFAFAGLVLIIGLHLTGRRALSAA
ncbi:MFS transporter [soil metagenome]